MLARRLLLGEGGDGGSDEQADDFLFTLYICISLFLVMMAGLMSGLTLGLMSLDLVELEVSRWASIKAYCGSTSCCEAYLVWLTAGVEAQRNRRGTDLRH